MPTLNEIDVKLHLSYLVLAMSTGIEAIVVTRPENILAKKWQNMPSCTYRLNLPSFIYPENITKMLETDSQSAL